MLHLRRRADRGGGTPLDIDGSPAVSMSSTRGSPTHTGISKSSLRDRLRGLKESITKRTSPDDHRITTDRTANNMWYDMKSDDDFDAEHIEMLGQTWPAVRKSISSLGSSFRNVCGSENRTTPSGDSSCQTWSLRSRMHLRACQQDARRWATVATRTGPVFCGRSTSQVRRASFSTISEVTIRQCCDTPPLLPGLAESGDFLESLGKTGLFRLFTPLPGDTATGHPASHFA
ncbi:hypothetical protein F4808DRAFT_453899 [Astrocystis sublimbata]|nr:hypothetical protein F4808DRAFT_453899 [Astrocystis sublimbata]